MDTLSFDVDSFFSSSQEIKREDMMGIPEVHTPEEPLTTKRKGTKRAHDPTEIDKRNNRRRENQKVACRNYRMRKKEHLSELKERIHQLEQEKEQLTKENLAHQMNKGAGSAVDPAVVTGLSEVARVLAELDNAIKMNVEDRVVDYFLQTFFVAANKLHNAFLKDVDDLVNPFTQVSLASLGYMTSMDYSEISQMQVGGWWDSFILSANLTPDQTFKLQEVINKLCKRDSELRMERGVLDKQIKQFYMHKLMIVPLLTTTMQPTEQLDAKTILDFTWLLNRLKVNIITSKSLLLSSQSHIGEILTSRQHASLVLTVCHSRFFEWPYHAQVLRAAWEMVSRSTADTTTISQNHPLTPPSTFASPYPSPYTSPYSPSYEHAASPPQYLTPSSPYLSHPSPPTVVPSIAIPTPAAPFPTQAYMGSPSLTPNCTPQLSSSGIVQGFLSSLNYGVY